MRKVYDDMIGKPIFPYFCVKKELQRLPRKTKQNCWFASSNSNPA